MDGNWKWWGLGVDPVLECARLGYPPPDIGEIEGNLRKAIQLMREQVSGRFCFGALTSTYCRDLFYSEPILSLYRRLIENGGEIAVHPHEELVGTAPLVHAKGHMEAIILQKRDELAAAGIQGTAFTMGLGAFDDCIPSILENAGIYVDLSASPGIDRWYWHAHWRNTSYSAYYLCPVHYTHVDCSHPKTKVLEIPWGNDGLGDNFSKNFLYVEAATLAENQRVWDAIVKRAETAGEPQFVYFKCHLSAMAEADHTQRLVNFLQYAQSHGGSAVAPSEAKKMYDRLRR